MGVFVRIDGDALLVFRSPFRRSPLPDGCSPLQESGMALIPIPEPVRVLAVPSAPSTIRGEMQRPRLSLIPPIPPGSAPNEPPGRLRAPCSRRSLSAAAGWTPKCLLFTLGELSGVPEGAGIWEEPGERSSSSGAWWEPRELSRESISH